MMLPIKTFRICYLCQGFKMLTSRNMCVVVSKPNLVPEQTCNLAKQLNVNNEALANIINKQPEKFKLFSESQWVVLFQYLNQYDFKTSELLEMIDSNPDLLNINRTHLHKSMSAWNNFRFDDKKLRQLIVLQPSCLLLDEKRILSRIPKLLSYVGKKCNRVLELISYSPNVLFDDWNQLESKFDYLLLDMELGPTQFVTSSALSATLFDLKCRHNFLIKLGMYKKRDPKANSNQILGNPSLKKIIETTEKQFAIKVAGVTAEEFFVFKKLFQIELDEKNTNSNNYDTDED